MVLPRPMSSARQAPRPKAFEERIHETPRSGRGGACRGTTGGGSMARGLGVGLVDAEEAGEPAGGLEPMMGMPVSEVAGEGHAEGLADGISPPGFSRMNLTAFWTSSGRISTQRPLTRTSGAALRRRADSNSERLRGCVADGDSPIGSRRATGEAERRCDAAGEPRRRRRRSGRREARSRGCRRAPRRDVGASHHSGRSDAEALFQQHRADTRGGTRRRAWWSSASAAGFAGAERRSSSAWVDACGAGELGEQEFLGAFEPDDPRRRRDACLRSQMSLASISTPGSSWACRGDVERPGGAGAGVELLVGGVDQGLDQFECEAPLAARAAVFEGRRSSGGPGGSFPGVKRVRRGRSRAR
jgi:hypothetical protein